MNWRITFPVVLTILYERVELPVQTVDGTRSAWVYVAGAAVEAAIRRGELRLIERGEW
jgi:AIG2-like family.